jgi:hypothetical protein
VDLSYYSIYFKNIQNTYKQIKMSTAEKKHKNALDIRLITVFSAIFTLTSEHVNPTDATPPPKKTNPINKAIEVTATPIIADTPDTSVFDASLLNS